MKADIKKLWTDALESGEYKQGRFVLRSEGTNDQRYCCLGVLTDLAVKAGVARWEQDDEGDWVAVGNSGSRCEVSLINDVLEWAGVDMNAATEDVSDFRVRTDLPGSNPNGEGWLSALNDHHVPFDNISKLIKEQM